VPQSLSAILIHLVFSTKNREPFITPAIERELHPYMAKIFRALKSPSLAIDGTADHVHILFSLGWVNKVADRHSVRRSSLLSLLPLIRFINIAEAVAGEV